MKVKLFFNVIIGVLTASIFLINSGFIYSKKHSVVDGKEIYKKNCSVCHRKNGKGIPNTFPPIAKSDFLIKHSKEEIISLVLKGQKGKLKVNGKTYNNVMLPLKHLSNDEIAAVLTYISTNFGNKGEKYSPEDVGKVRNLVK